MGEPQQIRGAGFFFHLFVWRKTTALTVSSGREVSPFSPDNENVGKKKSDDEAYGNDFIKASHMTYKKAGGKNPQSAEKR